MIEDTGGRVVAKVGAEGVHSVAVPDLGIGLAVKVEDGATARGVPGRAFGCCSTWASSIERLTPRLADYLRKPVRNSRNEIVGEIHTVA